MPRTMVIGDIHGCAEELERLLSLVRVDRVVTVGDLYTKGPDPAGVWACVQSHGIEAVRGNHDARLLDILAGRRPRDAAGHAVVAALDAADRSWRDHLATMPLWLEDVAGYTVVHAGLHPSGSLRETTESMALAMRRWPLRTASAAHWHAQYTGERRVIFGHDARGGLVRRVRDGVPWVMGLDTGCVYGGQLTAWVVEEDRLIQVPARRVYQSVSAPSV